MNFNKMLIQNAVQKRDYNKQQNFRVISEESDDSFDDSMEGQPLATSKSVSSLFKAKDLANRTTDANSREYTSLDPTTRLIQDLNGLKDLIHQQNQLVIQSRTNEHYSGKHHYSHNHHHHHHKHFTETSSSYEVSPVPTLSLSSPQPIDIATPDHPLVLNAPRLNVGPPSTVLVRKLSKPAEMITVEMRVVFLKIGEIDTLKEIYHAEVFIQARWREPKLDRFTPEELNHQDLHRFWNPLLYIDNILTDTKDQMWLTAEFNSSGEACLIERRRIKGVFLETLELNDFPLDVQDLTVTMTSERSSTEVDIVADRNEPSGINLQTFVDQQEWRLHEHVEVSRLTVTPDYTSSSKCHPCLSVTCRAARRPGYFYWNVFLIMFFITGLSFATFSVSHQRPENRLQLSFTLFLTSVAFKFVINQSLPKISYLTYMDKYVLMSLGILCIVSVWHAVITLIPDGPHDLPDPEEPHYNTDATSSSGNPGQGQRSDSNGVQTFQPISKSSNLTLKVAINNNNTNAGKRFPTAKKERSRISLSSKIEQDVFATFCAVYILAHLIFVFWLYFGASKRRREMFEKDRLFKQERSNFNV